MAPTKKTKMGADPLAWMKDGDKPPVAEVKTKPVERRRTPRVKKPEPGLNVELLEETFAALAPQGEALVKRFYQELFARYPGVRPMFANTSVAEQEKKLLGALVLVINNLRKPEALGPALTSLGAKHHGYGAKPEHYTAVAETLLDVMAEFAGDLWTEEVQGAWTDALNTVATTMLAAKHTGNTHIEDKTMVASKKVVEGGIRDNDQIIRMQSAVDGAMTAIMMIDRDFNITYANKSTLDLMKKHEATMRSVYPGFRSDALIGSNIDAFHANPAHQRQLLSNPNNLPYKTDIQVGPLKFSLNVTAQIDAAGNYIGNTLEWADVTDVRAKEIEVSRLQSAVDGAQANLMICDANLVITYCNPAVIEMMRPRQAELRQIWPGFDINTLVGSCIDVFHKNPAHQRALLSDPRRLPAKAEMRVADVEFEVNATMITGPNGEYMGNMVEWRDITEQKDAERQIQGMIEGAVAGQLNNRIDVDKYVGFLKGLGEGINNLMDAVVEPVQETRRVISGLAEGDLTQSMDGEFQGEFAELRDAVNATMNKLMSMVTEIGTASGTIASAANEISQGTADLSQRSEEQASSLEETASSMEELTGTVRQNADNAREATQLASGARDEATKGGEVVGKAIAAMSEINSSSKKIADIIGVIDEIAFQTNLLALNAAVEAARAGEQGRGFAVVAAEVRNLAQRSASAAKEIKTLINESVEKVGEGSKLVDQSGETLSQIVNSVKKVSDIIAEIASASQEQASGIDQINKAVVQMDEMTQQNAALVEEAAASSEAMNDQAAALDDLMGFFNTGDNNRRAAAPVQRGSYRDSQRDSQRGSHREPQRGSRPSASARPAAPARRRPAPRNDDSDGEWEEF
ncbi:MAG: methyl-accepting chemotaxis protein [Gammaproteobacteria bacterium]|nr:methyl-accepting chemotaxis protein [Gammaproteobacteria bacterium]